MREPRSNVSRWLGLTAASLILAACSSETPPVAAPSTLTPESGPQLAVGTPFNDAGVCMNDDVKKFGGGPVNCTANDIRIARADVSQVDGQVVTPNTPIQCTPGTPVTITMTAVLEATSNKRRDDIGVWIATDGGDAKTGQCRHYNLVDGSLGTVNGGDETADKCAGMESGAQTSVNLDTFTIPCNVVTNPTTGQPALKVGSCLAWKVPGQDELCPRNYTTPGATYTADDFRAATIPGTPAKCNCEGFYIPVTIVGKLTIIKDAVPDDAQDFAFTTTGAGLSAFSLDDDADATLSNTKLFTGLVNDGSTRTVTETAQTGWDLTNISCTGATQSTVTPNIPNGSVSVILRNGENVTCTYTNTKRASITITKVTNPASDPQDFAFTTSGTGLSGFSLDTDAGDATIPNTRTFTNLVPGNYSVTESATPGWDLTNLTCSAGGTPSGATANIVVPAGGNVSCTYTNTKRASITITKVTNPASDPQDFAFTTSGTGLSGFSLDTDAGDATIPNTRTFTDLVPGNYSVTEGAVAGWSLTNLTCSAGGTPAGTTANIVLAAGANVTCTYTNTKGGSITIVKDAVPNDAQDFAFTTTGTGLSGFSLDDDADGTLPNTRTFGPLAPGNYSVTETAVTGWDLTNLTCSAGGTPAGATANIVLAPGATVTCTYTNTKRATITVTKACVGGTGSFAYTGTTPSGTLAPFNLTCGQSSQVVSTSTAFGTYTVAETAQAGWDLTSAVCTGGGGNATAPNSIGLDAGENIVCTFTNTARGSITITKVTNPASDPQDFAFTTSGTGLSGFSLDTDAGDATISNTRTFTNLQAGTYSVTETATAGWDLTNLSCSAGGTPSSATANIVLPAGGSVTCTYTNTKRGSITIVKDAVPNDAQDFAFTTSGTGLSGFSLDDDADGTLPNTRTFPNLVPGNYSVTETATAGWDLTNVVCSAGGTRNGATANIALPAGGSVTCTYTNTMRATLSLLKVENGGLPLTHAWAFELRTGASTLSAGSVVASATANLTTGVVQFPGTFAPGAYQLCETGMLVGYSNNINGFTPAGAVAEGADNSTECINITLVSGANGPSGLTGVPNPIDNVKPPGGDARTIGYWKNWSSCTGGKQYEKAVARGDEDRTLDHYLPAGSALYPIGDITGVMGSATPPLTCDQAVNLLGKSDMNSGKKLASDPAYNLAAQFIAAKLNYAAGAKQCAAATTALASAQTLLAAIDFTGTGTYKDKITAQQASDLNAYATTLDKYNNNQLCP